MIKKHLNIAEGFQYSVNIEYDLGNEEKIKKYLMHILLKSLFRKD